MGREKGKIKLKVSLDHHRSVSPLTTNEHYRSRAMVDSAEYNKTIKELYDRHKFHTVYGRDAAGGPGGPGGGIGGRDAQSSGSTSSGTGGTRFTIPVGGGGGGGGGTAAGESSRRGSGGYGNVRKKRNGKDDNLMEPDFVPDEEDDVDLSLLDGPSQRRRRMVRCGCAAFILGLAGIAGTVAMSVIRYQNLDESDKLELERVCSTESLRTNDGRISCQDLCEISSCCFDVDTTKNCASDYPSYCEDYQSCSTLVSTLYSGKREFLPAPDDLEQVCSQENIQFETGFDTCEKACLAGNCCFPTDQVSNCFARSTGACAGYTPCSIIKGGIMPGAGDFTDDDMVAERTEDGGTSDLGTFNDQQGGDGGGGGGADAAASTFRGGGTLIGGAVYVHEDEEEGKSTAHHPSATEELVDPFDPLDEEENKSSSPQEEEKEEANDDDATKCTSKYVSRHGWDDCLDMCKPWKCCFLPTEQSGSCEGGDLHKCEFYLQACHPLHVNEEYHQHEDMPPDVEEVTEHCTEDLMKNPFGKVRCQQICHRVRPCCTDEDGGGSEEYGTEACSAFTPEVCERYKPCSDAWSE